MFSKQGESSKVDDKDDHIHLMLSWALKQMRQANTRKTNFFTTGNTVNIEIVTDVYTDKKFQEYYKTSISIVAFTVTLHVTPTLRFLFSIHFNVTLH